MLSKNQIKNIRSLGLKKQRDEQGLFIAEGEKLVSDLLPYFTCRLFIATRDWASKNPKPNCVEYELVDGLDDMKKVSFLTTPTSVLAVFEKPAIELELLKLQRELIIILDEIQNPGNLGTIIRIADWFGIKHIICSLNTADVYNSKTIQATMGALARVHVYYVNLVDFFQSYSKLNLPIYGTFLNGDNLHTTPLSSAGAIIFGNEGSGISNDVGKYVSSRILIPNYPPNAPTSESLNVAVAAAIVCAEFRRLG